MWGSVAHGLPASLQRNQPGDQQDPNTRWTDGATGGREEGSGEGEKEGGAHQPLPSSVPIPQPPSPLATSAGAASRKSPEQTQRPSASLHSTLPEPGAIFI